MKNKDIYAEETHMKFTKDCKNCGRVFITSVAIIAMIMLLLTSCNDKDLIDDLPETGPPVVELTELDAVLSMIGTPQKDLSKRFGYLDYRESVEADTKIWVYRTDVFKFNDDGNTEYDRREAVFYINADSIVSGAFIRHLDEGEYYNPNEHLSEIYLLTKYYLNKPYSYTDKIYDGYPRQSFVKSGINGIQFTISNQEEVQGELKWVSKYHVFQHEDGIITNIWITDKNWNE